MASICSVQPPSAERTGPGWDAMSTSLIPWSFATLTADIRGKEVQELVRSVGRLVHEEGSTFWTPGDLSRVAWSWAKLTQKDDTFFRRCSCLVIARLPEYTPSQLAQTIWAFATAAPSDACTHLLPKAAAAMLEGGDSDLRGLHAYTPQHLAMAVWSFAAVLYRPEELLKQIGEAVPYKLEKLNPRHFHNCVGVHNLASQRSHHLRCACCHVHPHHSRFQQPGSLQHGLGLRLCWRISCRSAGGDCS